MAPRLALVPGEPAGVGPELCVRLAGDPDLSASCIAYGDPAALQRAARQLGLPLRLVAADAEVSQPGDLRLVPIPHTVDVQPGNPDPRNARGVIDALLRAGEDCLQGHMDGMVTGPVHKAAINAGGIAYSGTTGLLAGQAGCDVVMMLARPDLRVALATTHLPLRDVPAAITPVVLERVLRILHAALRDRFGLPRPRITVLGLNPHAGESGLLGREELDTIIPVLERLRAEGLALEGPVPADTAFLPDRLPAIDAVLAMYHDQGLPVLKSTGIEHAVNITLGLPYPRVAVDHGTALDIAGRGVASPDSLFAAVRTCRDLATRSTR